MLREDRDLRPRLLSSKSGYDWWQGRYDTGVPETFINLSFERMQDGDNGAIWAEARAVAIVDEDYNTIIPPSRINLMNATRSGSGWKGLVSTLEDAVTSVQWDEAVATGVGQAIEVYRVGEREVELNPSSKQTGNPFLLEPFIASSGVSVFYGEGGTGKSLIGLGLAVAVAADYPVFGHNPIEPGPVVYFDYEDDSSIHEERLTAILKGLDIKLKYPIWHRKLVAKVSQSQASMRRTIDDRNAKLAVLDSIGMGRGGNANTAEDTVRMFRALRSLDVPTLAIDHVSKEDKRAGELISPYGSVYTINSARLLWGAVVVPEGSTETTKRLKLQNTKANRVALHKNMGLTLEYRNQRNDTQGRRWLDEVRFQVLDDFGQEHRDTAAEAITKYILHNGPTRPIELCDFLGLSIGEISRAEEQSTKLISYKDKHDIIYLDIASGHEQGDMTWDSSD